MRIAKKIVGNFLFQLREVLAAAGRWVTAKPLKAFVGVVVAAAALFLIVRTRQFNNLGLEKTLWEWLELLIVPLALVLAAWLLESSNKRVEWATTADTNRQQMMENFIKQVKDTIDSGGLDALRQDSDMRKVIKAQALAVLRVLDGPRKGYMLMFLHELSLLEPPSLFDTPHADLSRADMRRMNLDGISLRNANLSEANLAGTSLTTAALVGANLAGANLSGAKLMLADLKEADLTNAKLSKADLREADLKGADLTDALMKEAKMWSTNLTGAKITEKQKRTTVRRARGTHTS